MNTNTGAGPRTTPTVTLTLTEDQILMLARTLQRQGGTPSPELAELNTIVYNVADEIRLAQMAARRNARSQTFLTCSEQRPEGRSPAQCQLPLGHDGPHSAYDVPDGQGGTTTSHWRAS